MGTVLWWVVTLIHSMPVCGLHPPIGILWSFLVRVIPPLLLLECTQVRVLVTHNMSFISQCNHIVVLDRGRIVEEGNYSELIEDNGAFADFLRTYSQTDESQEARGWNLLR